MGSKPEERNESIETAEALERERQRIARGLHDHVGHALVEAQQALERVESTPDVQEARRAIDTALAGTRTMTFDLGLPPIGKDGLGGVLETLCRRTGANHEVDVLFEENGDARDVADGVILVLSQIVRELLFNVVKHARATSAAVHLEYLADRLRITVTDDGVGLTGAVNAEGFGLADSRNRLCDLGGRFEFGTKDGMGTRVVLELPVV